MRNITEEEHQKLMGFLEIIIGQMEKWVVTQCKRGDRLYDKFMSYPVLKLYNDTFSDLLVEDIPF